MSKPKATVGTRNDVFLAPNKIRRELALRRDAVIALFRLLCCETYYAYIPVIYTLAVSSIPLPTLSEDLSM
jgi:hypothetical protein